jgi:hypothetical protein
LPAWAALCRGLQASAVGVGSGSDRSRFERDGIHWALQCPGMIAGGQGSARYRCRINSQSAGALLAIALAVRHPADRSNGPLHATAYFKRSSTCGTKQIFRGASSPLIGTLTSTLRAQMRMTAHAITFCPAAHLHAV